MTKTEKELTTIIGGLRYVIILLTFSFLFAFLGLFTFYEVLNPVWDLVFRAMIITVLIIIMSWLDRIRKSKRTERGN